MPYLDQTGLSKLWARAKAVFAPAAHSHTAAEVNSSISKLPKWSAAPADTMLLLRSGANGAASWGQVTFLTLWNYIKGKADSVFAPKTHTHKASDITGLPSGGGYLEATIDDSGWLGSLYADGKFELHRRDKVSFKTVTDWVAAIDYPIPPNCIVAAHVTASDYRVEQLFCSPDELYTSQLWVAGRASEECDCEVFISVYGLR